MYRPYFGLTQLPFKTTPELDMFYREGSREEILQALEYTVVRGDGILKVVGEVGCGKTMILRLLASELSDEFKLVYVNSPNLSAKDMLLFICTELGLVVDEGMQKFTLINQLQKKLFELHSQGKKVVMLIDEAQAMTMDGLEEIRLLSNLETDRDKLLQIVLFGQPELDKALEHPNIRQLKSRITYSIYIPPLSIADVHSYLNFRMRKSGYSGIDVFNFAAAKRIHKLTGGYPRDINVLADKLLMAVFSQQDKLVQRKHFVAMESGVAKSAILVPISAILLLFVLGAAGVVYFVFAEKMDDYVPTVGVKQTQNQATITSKNDVDEDIIVSSDYTDVNNFDHPMSKINELDKKLTDDLVATADFSQPQMQLERLTQQYLHSSQKIIDTLSATGYSIQLATITLDSHQSLQQEFARYGIANQDVVYILDYKKGNTSSEAGFLRLKVYLGQEKTYSQAKTRLQNLPERLQRSKPFIVSFNTIRKEFNLALQFVNHTSGGSYVTES
ncbi:ExeA family protein [Thiosulfatimonas sediminis]|nr:AAA family ATPase [Thiosulfatimonas sediminis]